jgi:hypothetical protein
MVPEPVLVAIAAALAGKGVGSLYDLVRKKFADRREAAAALAAAGGTASDSAEVQALSHELELAERSDPTFATELRTLWGTLSATDGGVINQISGRVTGNVVQAHDIQGGVSF